MFSNHAWQWTSVETAYTFGWPLVFLAFATSYMVWRLWRFTIVPALHPQAPRETPYWFPILGHAFSLFQDYDGMLAYSRRYFGLSGETYKLTLLGQVLYLMTSPEDISKIYRNTEELTIDTHIRHTLASLGASSSAVDKWIPQRPSEDRENCAIGGLKPSVSEFTHLGSRICQQQLLPGKELDVLQKVFMNNIHKSLHWHSITPKVTVGSSQEAKTVSLLGWCREVLLESSTRAFFGDQLLELNPDLFQSFYAFDACSWKLHYGYPKILSTDLYAARDKIIETLTAYFRLPKAKRSGVAFVVDRLEDEMRQLEIGVEDIAALTMPLYWVINANAYKQCFWMMAHILSDSTLLASLREEIDLPVSQGTDLLEYRLEQQCPRLRAVYLEVLRLTASSSTVRDVKRQTQIGDKVLQSGANILIPYRQLHANSEIFGKDPDHFDPDRFLHNPDLSRSPSFRPFGGGKTYCPGRYLAEREILTFVALAVHRFEICLTPDRREGAKKVAGSWPHFPRIDKQKFCLGIMEPVKGDDLMVTIKQRTQ